MISVGAKAGKRMLPKASAAIFCGGVAGGKGAGFCGMGTLLVAARAAPHFWEEPLHREAAAGRGFFSGLHAAARPLPEL